jgi:hypothetical protein
MGNNWTAREGSITIGKFIVTGYADKRVCGNWTHVDRRYVDIKEKRGTKRIDRGEVDTTFQGNYELNALAGLGLIPTYTGNMAIRINKFHAIKPLVDRKGFKVYKRSLVGKFIDYCVLKDGITYHAKTIQSAIIGWNTKADAAKSLDQLAKSGKTVSLDDALNLGFCRAGIKLFTTEAGLKQNRRYPASDVLEALRNATTTRATFPAECQTFERLLRKKLND